MDKQIQFLKPFPKFCCSIGYIPTSYKVSLTYEEQLMWLCHFLEDTVIPTVNQNGEAVEELQRLFEVLQKYVEDYFDNLDVQEEINNKLDEMVEDGYFQTLFENIFKQYNKRLYNSSFGVNGWWTNSNGTKRSDRYNYRDNGIQAIYQDIDDYAEIGLTEMCYTIQLQRSGDTFSISGGDDFIQDLITATTYAESKGINIDTIRIMGTTTNTSILNSSAKSSYLDIIDEILEKFSNEKYKYFNVLNELHTTIIDDYAFALNCVNKIQTAGKKAIVSIELIGQYSSNETILNLLQYVDVVGLNVYPRCLASVDSVDNIAVNSGVQKTLSYFNKIKALNKPIFITETGVVDYYINLIKCSMSSNDVPEALRINSKGLANKELTLALFNYYGNDVQRIYNWWTTGLTYPTNCKDNSKLLCEALLQKARD